MSIQAALIIALLTMSVLCAILLYMVMRAVNEVMFLREDIQQAHDTEHAKCIGAVMAYVGDEWAAQVLDIAARDYASVESDGDKDRIGRLLWHPGGPPVPSIWLAERADRLRIMATSDCSTILDTTEGG